eukprot:TRINITY_DN3587_c0_g1_i3.p1 TRINITY_DN3587_c0_g1~~TRINITY_DN3587_c0_g1_i3.p1  ORF type:complete len:351 (+),score=74.32 TRINITY_DN3587_c0_g1_i3:794-1846(+)
MSKSNKGKKVETSASSTPSKVSTQLEKASKADWEAAIEEADMKTKEALKALQCAKDKIDGLNDQLIQERETFENLKSKLCTTHYPSQVILNIGGKKFSTSIDTLKKDGNNFFGAMFSGLHEVTPDKEGAYFIDRDGEHFRHILNFLRTGELIFPEGDKVLRKELFKEAEFYQIEGIIELLKPPSFFPDSSILEGKHEFGEVLNRWISSSSSTPKVWRLLYKGTRDGFTSAVFHQRCDNQGATYTLFKLGTNIFGGYNPYSWNSSNTSSNGSGSFLFVLSNSQGTAPTQYFNQNAAYGPYNYASNGPSFGAGYDLTFSNKNISFSQGYYSAPSSVFCSSSSGTINEVEVWV